MVDTQDLKSCGHNGCAGSSPAPGTEKRARVRARAITLVAFFLAPALTLTLCDGVVTSFLKNMSFLAELQPGTSYLL
jgi:hypothetical protein